jgi:hypothetical protein
MPYVKLGKVRGFSPVITVYKNEDEEYILQIQTGQGQFLTPNLCGFSPKVSVAEQEEHVYKLLIETSEDSFETPNLCGFSPRVSVAEQEENVYRLLIETSEDSFETPNLCGFTPGISVYEDTNDAYRLQITTASGSFITPNLRDVKCRIGDYYIQYPDMPAPLEADPPYPGVWDIWSHRAVMYGLSQAAPPSFVDYYTLVGTSIAAGATPVVCYHKTGNDFRLYQFIARTSGYTVPAELDPVRWTYLQPGIVDERQKCANALTSEDYEIGQQVETGSYQGMYVTEVIVPGGKFWSVEGGFRPPFVSGGRQDDRIRNMEGNIYYVSYPQEKGGVADGVFAVSTVPASGASSGGVASYTYNFKASRVVRTGDDNAPTNISTRFWRRVA